MKTGVYANAEKAENGANAQKFVVFLEKNGFSASEIDVNDENALSETDVLFVLGGDGTILRCAEKCARFGVKIVGVNYGTLGFLAAKRLTRLSATKSQATATHRFFRFRIRFYCYPASVAVLPRHSQHHRYSRRCCRHSYRRHRFFRRPFRRLCRPLLYPYRYLPEAIFLKFLLRSLRCSGYILYIDVPFLPRSARDPRSIHPAHDRVFQSSHRPHFHRKPIQTISRRRNRPQNRKSRMRTMRKPKNGDEKSCYIFLFHKNVVFYFSP